MKFFNWYGVLLTLILVVMFTNVDAQRSGVCPCPRNYQPVCANNGRTYPNKCVFDCEANSAQGRSVKLRMVAKSSCEDSRSIKVRSDDLDSNGGPEIFKD